MTRSDARGAVALARDLGGIAMCIGIAVALDRWWVDVLAVLAIGHLQFALGEALLHEASHYNLFATRRYNDWVEPLVGLPFLRTVAGYREEHLAHHRHMGSDEDWVVVTYRQAGLLDPEPRVAWAWWGRPLLLLPAWQYLVDVVSDKGPRDWARALAYWAIVLGVAAWLGSLGTVLLYWVLPMALVFATLLYWSEIEDHFNTVGDTRSNLAPWSNWLFHESGYHAVHHRYASIPWFRLREAHQAYIGDDGPDISHGFFDTWRQVAAPRAGTSETD